MSARHFFVAAVAILIFANRSPAPIKELVETPAPTKKSEPKATPVERGVRDSSAAAKFEGTWSGSLADNSAPLITLGKPRMFSLSEGDGFRNDDLHALSSTRAGLDGCHRRL